MPLRIRDTAWVELPVIVEKVATLVLSASAMTFTLASIPDDVTNRKLVIQASEPQGNGITRAYSKARRSQCRQPEGLLQVLLRKHRHR